MLACGTTLLLVGAIVGLWVCDPYPEKEHFHVLINCYYYYYFRGVLKELCKELCKESVEDNHK